MTMMEEGKNNRGGATTSVTVNINDQPNNNHPYYGTFQGVANFYHPPQPQPQPIPPPHLASPYYYQQYNHRLPVYAVIEAQPMREHRLPCCGLGLGWLLFIMGFFIGGVPWYFGAFFLLCVQMDYREKPGLIACTIASLLVFIAVTFGTSHRHFVGWS